MSNTELKEITTQPILERVELKDCRIPVEISEEVLGKFRYLCAKYPRLEWSGAFWYKVKGSIKTPETMSVEIFDFLLMDVGEPGYTEFYWNKRGYVDYLIENDYDEVKVGNVHSHNTMPVFFSGTDWKELNNNSPDHNFYLCLIVNNNMDMTAKMAFVGRVSKSPLMALDENGEEYPISMDRKQEDVMFVIDCDVERKQPDVDVVLEERMKYIHEEIERDKKEKEALEKKAKEEADRRSINVPDVYKSAYGSNFGAGWGGQDNALNETFNKVNNLQKDVKKEGKKLSTIETSFIKYCLRLGEHESEDDITDVDSLITDIYLLGINEGLFAKTVVDNYDLFYNNFWDLSDIPTKEGKRNHYRRILQSFLCEMKGFEQHFEVLAGGIHAGLKLKFNKLKN